MTMEMKIPPNLYGSTLLVPMTLNRTHDGCMVFFLELLRTSMLIIVSYSIQIIFLFELLSVISSKSRVKYKCSDDNLLLQCVCVFTFEAAVFFALRDTLSFASLISSARSQTNESNFIAMRNRRRSGGAIMEKERTFMDRVLRVGVSEEPWSLAGMTLSYQIWSFLTLAIPPILICVLLSWIGGQYITCSKDKEALIMNTVGVLFINELGDTLYHAFSSSALKEDIAAAKGITVKIGNQMRWSLWATSVFFPLLVLLYTLFVVFFGKMKDCPGYTLPDTLPFTLPHNLPFK